MKRNFLKFLGLCLLNISVLLISGKAWFVLNFGKMNFEQILFTLTSNLEGSDLGIISDFFIFSLPNLLFANVVGLVLFLAYKYLFNSLSQSVHFDIRLKDKAYTFELMSAKFKRSTTIFLVVSIFLGSIGNLLAGLGFVNFLKARSVNSLIYENSYVSPADVTITFPEEKRNLIYIFLESMESNFSEYPINGEPNNLIPGLTELAQENFSFSHTEGLGGARQVPTTKLTIGALVGHTSGIGLNIPIHRNSYGKGTSFLPGAISLGTILEDHGYDNYLILGSDSKFAGRDIYFSTHGNYELIDYKHAQEVGWIDEDYFVFWGYEDKKLFEFAKEELTNISKTGKPFNFSILTVDTHFIDGYVDEKFEPLYDIPYANAFRCSDEKVVEFIDWVSQQPFYENTTIILSGDHLTMNHQFVENTPDRRIYNAIINPPFVITDSLQKNREFTVFDFFPTTLELLNVTVEGHRLGLGTSLVSNKPTLLEEHGVNYFSELNARSSFYNRKFLRNK